MSVESLCNHRVTVFRATEYRDEYGDTVLQWDALDAPNGRNAWAGQFWGGDLQDYGPGEQQGTMRRWFLVKAFDVRERDVISVDAGPEAGKLYRVESVIWPTRPHQVNHIEVNAKVWNETLSRVVVVDPPESGSDPEPTPEPEPFPEPEPLPEPPAPGPPPGPEPDPDEWPGEPTPEPEPEDPGPDIEPGPGPTPPTALLFYDDFPGGVLSAPQNGVSWGGTNIGAAEMVGIVADPSTPSGYALGFTFGGNPNLADDAWAEQRMKFPDLPKCYLEMRLSIPANYVHRDATGADNNKLLRLWDQAYNPSMVHVGMSTLPRPIGNSQLIAEYSKSGGSGTGNYGIGPWTTVFNPGVVYDIGFEVTRASGIGIADGRIRMWVNDVLVLDRADLALCKSSTAPNAANVIRNGYLLGWSNSGFTETTVIKVQRVIVATERVDL